MDPLTSNVSDVPTAKPADRSSRSWQPLVSGRLRDECLDCVLRIVAEVDAEPDVMATGAPGPAASMMLLFHYLDRAADGRGFAARAERVWDVAADRASVAPWNPRLHGGLTELGWVAEHLWGDADGDLAASLDELLEAFISDPEAARDYDLISGLAGFGVYALERPRSQTARRCLQLVERRLLGCGVAVEDGVAWFTERHARGRISQQTDEAVCDLGVAHGAAGVVGVLALAQHLDPADAGRSALLTDAVRWILKQQIADTARSAFPALVSAKDGRAYLARTAWCYGDAGMVVPLLLAARALDNAGWEADVLAIARRSALRPAAETDAVDASVCHGSAGLAHIYNRLHHLTGEELFREAALRWLIVTLDRHRAGGVRALLPPNADQNPGWMARTLLTGAVGVALVLLAAASSDAPDWDRLLLLSPP
jgi:lantibiotic biosynthesis protein